MRPKKNNLRRPPLSHPPETKTLKKLIFILLLIGFFGKTKKENIHSVVNRVHCVCLVCFFLAGRPLTLHHCWPVLDDAFSALRSLMTQRDQN